MNLEESTGCMSRIIVQCILKTVIWLCNFIIVNFNDFFLMLYSLTTENLDSHRTHIQEANKQQLYLIKVKSSQLSQHDRISERTFNIYPCMKV